MLRSKTASLFAGRAATLLAGVLLACAGCAEPTPVGLWSTIDDATGKAKALVRIVENAGVLSGRIEQIFNPDLGWDGRCSKCRDKRKDQPVLGMRILTNVRKAVDEYVGGEILDPENGNVYSCKLHLSDDGQTLEVRGFIGISLFGRTQVWIRHK